MYEIFERFKDFVVFVTFLHDTQGNRVIARARGYTFKIGPCFVCVIIVVN